MAPQQHARLGASNSHRWFECPGSVTLSEGLPNDSSSYAREGQCAHAVAETCLNNGHDAADMIDRVIAGFEDIDVDEEMAEAVQVYLDEVRRETAQADDAELSIETKFDLSHIHKDCFGTNDACVYFPSQAKLVVFDYKHGRGVPVEVERNSQMMYYAIGALTGKHNRPLAEVELVIIQPRCPHPDGPIRRWATTPIDLLNWIAELKDAAVATEVEKPVFKAGEWCKFCPAAAVCPTLKQHVQDAARADFAADGSVVVSDPATYSKEALKQALDDADVIENWVRSVRSFAHHEAEAGRIPPGYKLVPKRPQRKWKSEERLYEEMASYKFTPDQLLTPGKLRSPAQMETFLKEQGLPKTILAPLWHSVSSGSVLAPLDDKRESVKPEAATEFAT